MGARRLAWVPLVAALAGALFAAPAAQATFHLIKIREVYPGSSAHPDSGYVELQMYEAGQNFLAGQAVTVYNASGTLIGTFTFSTDPAHAENQQTVLVGDSGVQATFGVAPDLTDAALSIPAAGGAVCWAGTIDCMSWGSFSGSTASPSGSPADHLSGIPDGMALRRTIAPSCPTLLEGVDDTGNSSTDFFDATPNPRNDLSPITETACTGPTTTIDTKPANPTSATTASFTYHSTPSGASFECKLDLGAFASCEPSGIDYSGPLTEGSHTFQVRATNLNGIGAAASYTWQVDTTPPTATILSHPQDPSPGNSAAFTYSSSESGSTFRCSLEPAGEAAVFTSCPSTGKSYPDAEHPAPLADGSWTFSVRATDRAANQGTAGEFSWEVDNSLADTTPPETTILSKPPDPSDSSTASFTYESSEAGSSFECKLDGGAFASCPSAGVSYGGLADGSHSFLVRAIDSSGNVDPTPAGDTFAAITAQAPLQPPAVPPSPAPAAPPETEIAARPPARTTDRTPTVRFGSTIAGARFQCRVDRSPFRPCRSPFTTERLSPGSHLIAIRAIAGGMIETVPATVRFRVLRGGQRRRTARHRHSRSPQRRAG